MTKFPIYSTLVLLCLCLTSLYGNNDTQSARLTYDFDNCQALIGAEQHFDYSEFTAVVESDSECNILSSSGSLFRVNPTVNNHSCTAGFTGTAMCVSAAVACQADFSSENRIIVPFSLSGSADQNATLTSISFQHRSPDVFEWIQGETGDNNPPSLFAVRLLRDGVEVFRSEGNATNDPWNLANFQFSGGDAFATNGSVAYQLEILPYCVSGSGDVMVWDIDDLMINASCATDLPQGGVLSTTDLTDICLNAGSTSVAFSVSGNSGANSTLVIADMSGTIIALTSAGVIDFATFGAGSFQVLSVSYEDVLENATIGNNIQNITGCFALSNAVAVNSVSLDTTPVISSPSGSTITFCVDPMTSIDLNSTNAGAQGIYVALNGNMIVATANSVSDLFSTNLASFDIARVEFVGNVSGLEAGASIDAVTGCVLVSNRISFIRQGLAIPTISAPQQFFDICARDGIEDIIQVSGSAVPAGGQGRFVITDSTGRIIDVRTDGSINADGLPLGDCFINYVVSEGPVFGLFPGGNIDDLSGCFAVSSTSIQANKRATGGGVFATAANTTSVNVCRSNGSSLTLETVLRNNIFPNIIYPVVDENNIVTGFLNGPTLDLSSLPTGRVEIYALSFDGQNQPAQLGMDISLLAPSCDVLSNPIVVNINEAGASSISVGGATSTEICFSSQNSNSSVAITETGGIGAFSNFIVTDLAGNILSFQGSGTNVSVSSNFGDECQIWNIRHNIGTQNLAVGSNVSEITGCFELSNPINVSKLSVNPGVIATLDNTSDVRICSNDPTFSLMSANLVAASNIWLLTTTDGTIISSQNSNSFNLSGFETGSFRVYRFAYNGTLQAFSPGTSVFDLSATCGGLTNFVQVSLADGNTAGGSISVGGGSSLTLCPNNLGQAFQFDTAGAVGMSSLFLAVDASGQILRVSNSNSFALNGISSAMFQILSVSFNGSLFNATVGNNINSLDGCFSLSNSIAVSQDLNFNGGTLSFVGTPGDELQICVGIGTNDPVAVAVAGAGGAVNQLLVTDDAGMILALPASSPLNFESIVPGVCFVYNVASDMPLDPNIVGTQLSSLSGCFDLSNALRVVRNSPDAGTISVSGSSSVTVCVDDSGLSLDVDFSGGGSGAAQYLVTDADLNILSIQSSRSVSISNTGTGTCLIWRIATFGEVGGLAVGQNAANLTGCFDLSNSVTVTKQDPVDASMAMSTVMFSFEECNAFINSGTNQDYSEFQGVVTNDASCAQLGVVNAPFRNNPETFTHSCTPGVNGGVAICVSPSDNCAFENDSDFALRFDVSIAPNAGSSSASLTSLSFYEQAPEEFAWILGDSGQNRFPIFYGVRVVKDGEEVFSVVQNPTGRTWSLQEFDFSGLADFEVTTETTFSFELLGYCLTDDNDSPVSVWDVDQIIVKSNCSSDGGCPQPTSASTSTVEGRVKTFYGEDISHVAVELGEEDFAITNNIGRYEINTPVIDQTYTLTSGKEDEAINGLSVLDIILVQRHILGLITFEEEGKLIAADVNFDGNVTALDLVEMRRVLLGTDTDYRNGNEWVFYSAESMSQFEGIDVFNASREVIITPDNYQLAHDFVGIKAGDVDGSADVNGYKARIRSGSRNINYQINSIAEGTYSIKLSSADALDLMGLQFDLNLNGGDIAELNSEVFALNEGNYHISEDNVKVVLSGHTGVAVDDDSNILTITVNSKVEPSLTLSNNYYSNVVLADLSSEDVRLNRVFGEEELVTQVLQNQPNPFSSQTTIDFVLGKSQNVEFSFFNSAGQQVHRRTSFFNKGTNNLVVSRDDLNDSGVIIYRMKTEEGVITKKMIVL